MQTRQVFVAVRHLLPWWTACPDAGRIKCTYFVLICKKNYNLLFVHINLDLVHILSRVNGNSSRICKEQSCSAVLMWAQSP